MASPEITEGIGYVAAAIGTVLMLPQVVKSARTRNAGDVSGLMLAAYLTQCLLWLTYGALKSSGPLIACNSVAFCIGTAQVWLKVKYGRPPGAAATN